MLFRNKIRTDWSQGTLVIIPCMIFGLSAFISKKKCKTYRFIIFHVVLYGFDNSSLTLREKLVLRVFGNRVLMQLRHILHRLNLLHLLHPNSVRAVSWSFYGMRDIFQGRRVIHFHGWLNSVLLYFKLQAHQIVSWLSHFIR
jgi:hypothetical protein